MHYRQTILWNKALSVAEAAYALARTLPREEVFGMRSQLTRAALSVPCNIAEGWTRESPREKASFLAISQGSLAEVETLVTMGERLGWFEAKNTNRIRELIEDVSRMLTSLRRRFRSERDRSPSRRS